MKKLCICCHGVAAFTCSHFYVCTETKCGQRIQKIVSENLSIDGKRKYTDFKEKEVQDIISYVEVLKLIMEQDESLLALLGDPGALMAYVSPFMAKLMDRIIVRVDYPYEEGSKRTVRLQGQGVWEITLLSSLELFARLGVRIYDVISSIIFILSYEAWGNNPVLHFTNETEEHREWRKLAKSPIALQLLHFFVRSEDILDQDTITRIFRDLNDVFINVQKRDVLTQDMFDLKYRVFVYIALLKDEYYTRIIQVHPYLDDYIRNLIIEQFDGLLFQPWDINPLIKTNRLLPMLFLLEYNTLGPRLPVPLRRDYYFHYGINLNRLSKKKKELSASQTVPWNIYPIIYSLETNLNLNVLQPKLSEPLLLQYQQILLETSPDKAFPVFVSLFIPQRRLDMIMPAETMKLEVTAYTIRFYIPDRVHVWRPRSLFVFCSSTFLLHQTPEILNLLVYTLRREREKISILNDDIRGLDVKKYQRKIKLRLRDYIGKTPVFELYLENKSILKVFADQLNPKVHDILMKLENQLTQIVQSVEIFTGQHYNYVSKADVWKVYNDALESAAKKKKT